MAYFLKHKSARQMSTFNPYHKWKPEFIATQNKLCRLVGQWKQELRIMRIQIKKFGIMLRFYIIQRPGTQKESSWDNSSWWTIKMKNQSVFISAHALSKGDFFPFICNNPFQSASSIEFHNKHTIILCARKTVSFIGHVASRGKI